MKQIAILGSTGSIGTQTLDDDAPVLQGESMYTAQAEEVGLIDGKRTLLEAIAEVAELGDAYIGAQSLYGFS